MLVRFDPESDISRASLVGSHAYLVVDLQVMPFSAFLNPRVRALCLPGLQDLGVAQLGSRNPKKRPNFRHLFTSCRPIIYLSTWKFAVRRMHSTIRGLFKGNLEYIAKMSKDHPGLLLTLAKEGQRPPFMLIHCSDSRVNEQEIFSAQPGTLFTAGNIANRFDEEDLNSNAVLSFAVGSLNVKHVIVLGHYGCGGVAASMMRLDEQPISPADIALQKWVAPIREIYATSTRKEIISHREKSKTEGSNDLPDFHDPAFRALVEENVKSNVEKIANSAVIRSNYKNLITNSDGSGALHEIKSSPEIYIHGWVYDLEEGKVSDLGVSVGPPGKEVPASPFPLVNIRLDSKISTK